MDIDGIVMAWRGGRQRPDRPLPAGGGTAAGPAGKNLVGV